MFFLREWRIVVTEKGGRLLLLILIVPCALLLSRMTNAEAFGAPWLWFVPLPGAVSIALDFAGCAFMVYGITCAPRGGMADLSE